MLFRSNCVYDKATGQLLTGSFMDYAMPHATQVPDISFAYNEVPCTANPLGVKGSGEAGAIGAPPATINAAPHPERKRESGNRRAPVGGTAVQSPSAGAGGRMIMDRGAATNVAQAATEPGRI